MPSNFESVNEALIACVKACGGSKQVGHKLWPEKTVDAAQRHLLACLNEDKPERLSPEQLTLLMRMGHEKGFHGVMEFFAADVGYSDPVPTDPRDELVELLKTSNELRERQIAVSTRIEKLMPHAALKAVA
ncbi:MAG: hypothetical protein RIQ53_4630 [Pseudomonadota bacterium]